MNYLIVLALALTTISYFLNAKPMSVIRLKVLGIKPNMIEIISTWDYLNAGRHHKFQRFLLATNGRSLRQVISCSSSSSDINWARVVSRDFKKRENEKDLFLSGNVA